MTKKLTEEWRGKLQGIFEGATANTIFEMPETEDDLAVADTEVPTDLGMGDDDVVPVDGETITLTKDALRELLLAVKSEEAEEVADEIDDEVEDEIEGEGDEEVIDDVADDVEDIEEEEGEEVAGLEEPLGGEEVIDDIADEIGDVADDTVEDSLEDEDAEVTSIVDKAFEIAAGGTLDASQVPDIVGDLEADADLDAEGGFPPVDGEEEVSDVADDLGAEEDPVV